jgi:hypothetical protein
MDRLAIRSAFQLLQTHLVPATSTVLDGIISFHSQLLANDAGLAIAVYAHLRIAVRSRVRQPVGSGTDGREFMVGLGMVFFVCRRVSIGLLGLFEQS